MGVVVFEPNPGSQVEETMSDTKTFSPAFRFLVPSFTLPFAKFGIAQTKVKKHEGMKTQRY